MARLHLECHPFLPLSPPLSPPHALLGTGLPANVLEYRQFLGRVLTVTLGTSPADSACGGASRRGKQPEEGAADTQGPAALWSLLCGGPGFRWRDRDTRWHLRNRRHWAGQGRAGHQPKTDTDTGPLPRHASLSHAGLPTYLNRIGARGALPTPTQCTHITRARACAMSPCRHAMLTCWTQESPEVRSSHPKSTWLCGRSGMTRTSSTLRTWPMWWICGSSGG